jgi:hypothetical protein
MNTDRSSKAYIAQIQAQNIIASVANGTPGGVGYQGALTLGKINSVIDGPPEPEPEPEPEPTSIVLTYEIVDISNGYYMLVWTPVATSITDTLIEYTYDSQWETLEHSPLLDISCFDVTVPATIKFRVSSVTDEGTSEPSNVITIIPAPNEVSFVAANGIISLMWVNRATDITETLIETNTGSGWTEYTTRAQGDATTIAISGISTPVQVRLTSVTSVGTSDHTDPIMIE